MKHLAIYLLIFICHNLTAQSLSFDGTNDYVQSTYAGISGTGARTVEAWIQTSANADPNNGGVQQVITDWGTMSTGARFTFNVLFNNGLRIEVQGSGLNSTKAINDGQWHHVAAVYDPNATYKFRLLVDGKLDTFGNISTTLNTVSSVPFLIGKRIDNTNFFAGKIDEVRVFNFARTDSAIKADMRKEFCSTVNGLTAYYKLNEGTPNSNSNTSKTTALDYSGNNNSGTLYNFTLRGTSSNWVSGAPVTGKTSATIKAFACSSYVPPSGKKTIYSTGTFLDTIPNRIGCDSIITINLTIGKTNTTLNISACDSFKTPKGQVVYTNAFITETYTSYRNCDSIINYNISVFKRSLSNVNITACDSFISRKGKVYKTSGKYSDTFKTYSGCDSIYMYNVLINNSVKTSRSIVACDSAKIYNATYYQSITLKFVFKTYLLCDSIETINLTVNKSNLKPIALSTCDSFVSPKGNIYKTSGIYNETFQTHQGCDSIVRYNLTVHASKSTFNNLYACRNIYFHGKFYDSSIVISEKLKTANGCDSIVTTTISVTKIDTSLMVNQNTLTCNMSNADSFAWLNCSTNQIVPNENKASFKPSYSGEFAAIIGVGNCFDTTACYQIHLNSLNDEKIHEMVTIYPNPNTGFFQIKTHPNITIITIDMIDIIGQPIKLNMFNNGNYYSNLEALNKGIYSLRLQTENGVVFYKINVL